MSDALAAFILKQARWKALQLVGKAGIKRQDVDDVAQDLVVCVYRALGKHDPKRAAIETFVCMVIVSKAKTLLGARRAAKNGLGIVDSLEEVDPQCRYF